MQSMDKKVGLPSILYHSLCIKMSTNLQDKLSILGNHLEASLTLIYLQDQAFYF